MFHSLYICMYIYFGSFSESESFLHQRRRYFFSIFFLQTTISHNNAKRSVYVNNGRLFNCISRFLISSPRENLLCESIDKLEDGKEGGRLELRSGILRYSREIVSFAHIVSLVTSSIVYRRY